MDKKKFIVSFTVKGTTYNKTEFYTDNIFKDAGEWMAKVAQHSLREGTFRIERVADGHYEEFWLKKGAAGHFIQASKESNYTDLSDEPVQMAKSYYLVCLDEATNEYKHYTCVYNKTRGIVNVDYGRLGQAKGTYQGYNYVRSKDGQCVYTPKMFWVKYYEKIEKGYRDVTNLKDFHQAYVNRAEAQTQMDDELGISKIPEKDIARVIRALIEKQNQTVRANYDMTLPSSPAAIKRASELLSQMVEMSAGIEDGSFDRNAFREIYKDYLITVPRQISDVAGYLNRFTIDDPSASNYLPLVLDEERALLQNFIDVYRREHGLEGGATAKTANTRNVLTANGLSAEYLDYKEQWEIEDRLCSENGRGHIEDKRHHISGLFRVVNEKTQKRYEETIRERKIDEKHQHLYFHGSRTQNWWSIYLNGLSLGAKTVHGSLFGKGLYFAPLARKALGYTDFLGAHWTNGQEQYGYLALFKVAMKNPYKTKAYGTSVPTGYDSIYAQASASGLQNDECIVYDEKLCTIAYLIEMDSDRHTFKNITFESARKLLCLSPVYDKDKNSITAICNLSDIIKDADRHTLCEYRLDDKKVHFSDPAIENRLYDNEREYLTGVFASNFAKNPYEFAKWVDEMTGKDQKDIVASNDQTKPAAETTSPKRILRRHKAPDGFTLD